MAGTSHPDTECNNQTDLKCQLKNVFSTTKSISKQKYCIKLIHRSETWVHRRDTKWVSVENRFCIIDMVKNLVAESYFTFYLGKSIKWFHLQLNTKHVLSTCLHNQFMYLFFGRAKTALLSFCICILDHRKYMPFSQWIECKGTAELEVTQLMPLDVLKAFCHPTWPAFLCGWHYNRRIIIIKKAYSWQTLHSAPCPGTGFIFHSCTVNPESTSQPVKGI